ncbi:MAG: DUF6421 family protein [Actinomycetes bacterium]
MNVSRPAAVRVLVDEAHQQAWATRPQLAAQMQPAHPADSSYAKAAALLRRHDFLVEPLTDGPLTAEALADVAVLVLPHASSPKYEATTGVGSARYDAEEIEAITTFVASGGGLVVLAESEQDKYDSSLGAITELFGITVEHCLVQDYQHHHQAPSWVNADLAVTSPLLSGVDQAVFYRTGTLTADANATVLARSSADAAPASAGLLASTNFGRGRVVVSADSDLFGDDCIDSFGHSQLWLNIAYWTALHTFAAQVDHPTSAAASDPHWANLKAGTEELRSLQGPDATIDLSEIAIEDVRACAARIETALQGLSPHFPHQADYLAQAVADLDAWIDGGCRKPDFGSSLRLFRPELHRADGVEHLVFFPMYTPNGSLDVRFEALIVHVPWPTWIADLERERFRNDKFVPVHLVDNTAGYDSECAVLFPETVSVVGDAANTFGGIFCDREAARYQRVVGEAVTITNLELPPNVTAMLASEPMTRDMFELWDLIHDRAHSHGELPFDPFMIRQRLPFWMYSLEELRCDLTAFHQAGELAEQFPFALNVQYGVLFDRLFRFPLTGGRVRNYDGLAGQLLFGYLHRTGVLTWRDNKLSIDWERLSDAVNDLRIEIEGLYRDGISSSKVRYWIAAHDLVSRYVQPNLASEWTPEARAGRDESDHKAWVSLVNPDEFPLSMFYQSLATRLLPAIKGDRRLAA